MHAPRRPGRAAVDVIPAEVDDPHSLDSLCAECTSPALRRRGDGPSSSDSSHCRISSGAASVHFGLPDQASDDLGTDAGPSIICASWNTRAIRPRSAGDPARGNTSRSSRI